MYDCANSMPNRRPIDSHPRTPKVFRSSWEGAQGPIQYSIFNSGLFDPYPRGVIIIRFLDQIWWHI